MKAGLITTLNTNVGDDLIRLGIKRVIDAIYGENETQWVEINKHEPWTAFRWPLAGATVRYVQTAPRGRAKLQRLFDPALGKLTPSLFDDCDFIVQCGAPVYWTNCHEAEWALPLWYGVVSKLARRIPACNLAAGSCFPWSERETPSLYPQDKRYIADIHGLCRATTARDTLAEKLCGDLGLHSELICCAALLSASREETDRYSGERNGRMLVNYMPGGGHYTFGQDIDAGRWETVFRDVLKRFAKRYEIVYVCHNQKEVDAARALDAAAKIVLVPSAEGYHEAAGAADIAFCNRMHASVGLASLGIPSVAVGTDTRLMMVRQIGLPAHFVNDVTADSLEADLEDLIARRAEETQRLLALKDETFRQYVALLKDILPSPRRN